MYRRTHLRDGWFFSCRCSRCQDKTEGGTYSSAFKDFKGCGGIVLPCDPLGNLELRVIAISLLQLSYWLYPVRFPLGLFQNLGYSKAMLRIMSSNISLKISYLIYAKIFLIQFFFKILNPFGTVKVVAKSILGVMTSNH